MQTFQPVPQTAQAAVLFNAVNACAEGMRARTAAAERDCRVPAETIATLSDAGVFRVYQPREYGGAELPMQNVLPLISEIARACPSTAWVSAVLQIHTWLLTHFSREAQDEVFRDDPAARIAGVLQPRAMVTAVDGGYQLSAASWPYASGCDHCQWFELGGLMMNEAGPPTTMLFLVPREGVEIADDWQVSGLRGTGSKTVSMGETFVPAHRALSIDAVIAGETAAELPSLYKSAILPMLCLNVTGPALGLARSAVECFKTHIAERKLPFSPAKQADAAQTHRTLAEVMLKVDTADLQLQQASYMVREHAEAGRSMSVVDRNLVRAFSSAAVRGCVQAVSELFLASGGTALQQSHPLQQMHRDVYAMAQHAALVHENNLELLGAAALGKPLNSPFA